MEIAVIRERQEGTDLLSRISQNFLDRFQTAFNITDNETETLILPVVPTGLKFPTESDITNLKGIISKYNVPSSENLQTLTIESIFPVNKNYPWINMGSNINGYDYVDFFAERQQNQLPFRLVAYAFSSSVIADEINTTIENRGISAEENGQALFRVHCDRYFSVKKFDYEVDKTGDIKYSLAIEQFNEDFVEFPINWGQFAMQSGKNLSARYALRKAGLI